MHRPPQHAPFAVATSTPAATSGCRAPYANDLTDRRTSTQSAALMSLVRILARQAADEVRHPHGTDAAAPITANSHPLQKG